MCVFGLPWKYTDPEIRQLASVNLNNYVLILCSRVFILLYHLQCLFFNDRYLLTTRIPTCSATIFPKEGKFGKIPNIESASAVNYDVYAHTEKM